jgi:hypothetical protein
VTKYEPELAAKAAELAVAGKIDREIATELGVDVRTLHRWKKRPVFHEALKSGKDVFDDRVEAALGERATGYEHEVERIVTTRNEVHRVKVIERVPADVQAAKWWMANRRPKSWSLTPRGARKALDFGVLDGTAKSIATAGVRILQLMAAGELSVEEGQAAATVLAAVSKSLEVGQLEERIQQLEGYEAPKQIEHQK